MDYTSYLKTISLNIIRDRWRSKQRKGRNVNIDEVVTPESNAILGSVNQNTAEVLTRNGAYSLRWQEDGLEYLVVGNVSLEELIDFAKILTKGDIQIPEGDITRKPEIEVEVDLEVEENTQKNVDAGHSPWRLDPAFAAQVFISLLISPEGITGDYPIDYTDIKINENTGTEAIAEISSEVSPIRFVYLKRLVRQDDTGIWTVIGYDPK